METGVDRMEIAFALAGQGCWPQPHARQRDPTAHAEMPAVCA